MTSYYDTFVTMLTNAAELVQVATETVGSHIAVPGPSNASNASKSSEFDPDNDKDPNNNQNNQEDFKNEEKKDTDDWVDLEEEIKAETRQKMDQEEDFNYVCPSVEFEIVPRHTSFVVCYNHVHEPTMEDSFYLKDSWE